ncbi:hypothetical protein PGB90_009267 [Kerria lacca]
MGSLPSRQNTRNEEADLISNQMYKYPPKSGNYFSSYFIMGGEKFDAPQPEAYLFGDNMDLNFLGSRPVPVRILVWNFPYPPPQTVDPTRPLKCLVNIRKESVRFLKINDQNKNLYNVEFSFDADVKCSIRIYYFCTEEITCSGITYYSKDEKLTSDLYYYKRGCNQQFVQSDHIFDPSLYSDEDLFYNIEKDTIPVAIQCIALEGSEVYLTLNLLADGHQSHTTIAIIERHADNSYSLKALKQKLFIDGLCYLLQEIYGIENKVNEWNKLEVNEEIEDGGLECVICMSEMRDTLILPCRHLCLCQACADSLRYQANNCPICRSPFRALLQIKAMQKYSGQSITTIDTTDGIPGFEHIPLIEALNGPMYAKRYVNAACTVEPLSDYSEVYSETPVIYTSLIRNTRNDRLIKSIRVKNGLCGKNNRHEENEIKEEVSPVIQGKLASHDTEDEDKSSSITDHLLHDKSVLCSPDTTHHTNEISNTEDEMPDEDSDIEKSSPLLEIGISFENDTNPHTEITIIDPEPSETSYSIQFESSDTKKVEKQFTNSTDEKPQKMKHSTEDFSNSPEDLKSSINSSNVNKSTAAEIAVAIAT